MNRHQKRMNELLSLLDSGHKDPHVKFKLVAAIYKGNRNLAYGFNSFKTDPMQARYSYNYNTQTGTPKEKTIKRYAGRSIPQRVECMHAEVSALKNALKKYGLDEIEGSTIYVARKLKDGSIGNAKPCKVCQIPLKLFKIKSVYYTDDDSTFTCEEIND